jgi:DnaJ-domain-containing protein 1
MSPRSEPQNDASCWHCGAVVPQRRLDVETVLHARTAEDGGPYSSFVCASCAIPNGALQNALDEWMLYPLEGLDEPSLIDWISPRYSRDVLRNAVTWWERNRGAVERFRRVRSGTRRRRVRPATTKPRKKRRQPRTREEPPPREEEPEPEVTAPREPVDLRDPQELLGVSADADEKAIGAAYRKALKLCHPDRVSNLDPEIQELAHRKAKALRRAYESLLAARRRRTQSAG